MKTLSIVVPVYYNRDSLEALFEKLLQVEGQLAELDLATQIVFVDDGSGDDSWDVLLGLKQRRPATRLIKLSRNFGAVHASKTGFRYVEGDCFMIVAADLQDPPEVLHSLLQPVSAANVRDISLYLELDASQITWIATANYPWWVPATLRSAVDHAINYAGQGPQMMWVGLKD